MSALTVPTARLLSRRLPGSRHQLSGAVGRAALIAFASLAVGVAPATAADQAPAGGQAIGDFNGDGFGDFIARETADPQRAVVAFGSAGTGVVQLPGEGGSGLALGGTSGLALPVRVGDVDGDGYDDLIEPALANRSWLIYGAAGAAPVDLAVPGPRITTLVHDYASLNPIYALFPAGQQAYGVGDFNGDGFDDWVQSRYSPLVTGSTAALPKSGGGVVVLGGPRVAQLETRGSGGRLIQIDTSGRCQTRWSFFIPNTQCWWVPIDLAAIGDYDGDGKADLHSTWTPGFVIRGRASTATFSASKPDAATITEPVRPTTDPWAPRVVVPPADPGSVGTLEWTLDNAARRLPDGSVNVVSSDFITGAGAVFDTRRTVNANELVVDFDLQLIDSGGAAGNGNGATLAFASKSLGGFPRAANFGIGLGWVGNKGNAVTFGTVKGTYTPSDNYVGLASGTVGKSGYPTFLQTAPAVSRLRNSTNHITVKATGGVVTVAINGVERLRRTMALPTDAYVGFTAGTSGARQDHIVKNVVVKKP